MLKDICIIEIGNCVERKRDCLSRIQQNAYEFANAMDAPWSEMEVLMSETDIAQMNGHLVDAMNMLVAARTKQVEQMERERRATRPTPRAGTSRPVPSFNYDTYMPPRSSEE